MKICRKDSGILQKFCFKRNFCCLIFHRQISRKFGLKCSFCAPLKVPTVIFRFHHKSRLSTIYISCCLDELLKWAWWMGEPWEHFFKSWYCKIANLKTHREIWCLAEHSCNVIANTLSFARLWFFDRRKHIQKVLSKVLSSFTCNYSLVNYYM